MTILYENLIESETVFRIYIDTGLSPAWVNIYACVRLHRINILSTILDT